MVKFVNIYLRHRYASACSEHLALSLAVSSAEPNDGLVDAVLRLALSSQLRSQLTRTVAA